MTLNFKRLALYSLYFYIASLYSLAYDEKLNMISKVLFIMTIGLFLLHTATNAKIIAGKIYVFFFAYTLYSTISCFWSRDFSIAFSRNITLYQIVVMVFIIYNLIETEIELDSVFQSIFWGTMVMCMQTVLKHGIGNIFNMMLNGIRIGTEINQANAFGYYCAIAFLVAIYNVIYKKQKIFLLLAIIPVIFSFASGSRKSIIVVILATALIFALKNGKLRISQIVIAFAVCILLFALLYSIEPLQPLFKRFTAMLDMFGDAEASGDTSIEKRMDMIDFGLQLFKKKVFFGYGTEQYNVMYQLEFGEMRPAHNNYIQSLVSFGIAGTSIFYGMYMYIAVTLCKNLKYKNPTSILMLVITATELVNQVTAGAFLNKFTYIYLALAFVCCNLSKQNSADIEAKGSVL